MLWEEENSVPAGNGTPIIQLTAHRYTNTAIVALVDVIKLKNSTGEYGGKNSGGYKTI
jgi:hypothetical protein